VGAAVATTAELRLRVDAVAGRAGFKRSRKANLSTPAAASFLPFAFDSLRAVTAVAGACMCSLRYCRLAALGAAKAR